jgi:hypothetical protein
MQLLFQPLLAVDWVGRKTAPAIAHAQGASHSRAISVRMSRSGNPRAWKATVAENLSQLYIQTETLKWNFHEGVGSGRGPVAAETAGGSRQMMGIDMDVFVVYGTPSHWYCCCYCCSTADAGSIHVVPRKLGLALAAARRISVWPGPWRLFSFHREWGRQRVQHKASERAKAWQEVREPPCSKLELSIHSPQRSIF